MSELLKRNIPFSPPDISDLEIEEVIDTLKSGWITTGPKTKRFERRLAAYIETGNVDIDTETNPELWKDRVVCLNSATAAEELNLRVFGIKPGDEVIIPAYTYTATASAAIHCGARVRFVDIQRNGNSDTNMPEMDYEELEKAITPKTKAIIAVDLGGIVCDYEKIYQIVERKKSLFSPTKSNGSELEELSSRIQKSMGRIAIFADDAHSLGASRIIDQKRKYCGQIADFTSFSFHAVKNITTAEGGAATWLPIAGIDNSEIYRMYQLLSLHGQSKDALSKTKKGSWEYDIVGPWYKCNMTDIMASIGLRQLDRYIDLLNYRKRIIDKYDDFCEKMGLLHLKHHTKFVESSNHLYLVRIPNYDEEKRNKLIASMALEGVALNVHYKPLPMMTAYKDNDCSIDNYPNSYEYYKNLITLPLHTLLSEEDVEYLCSKIQEYLTMNTVK